MQVPREIKGDRDPKFTLALWTKLMEKLDAKLRMSSSHHPQTDGQTERTTRTLNEQLRAYTSTLGREWHKYLGFAEFAYNDIINPTGHPPFQLVYGQDLELPWQFITPGKKKKKNPTLMSVKEFLPEDAREYRKSVVRAGAIEDELGSAD